MVGLVSPSQGRQVAKRQGVMGGESGEEEHQGRTHTRTSPVVAFYKHRVSVIWSLDKWSGYMVFLALFWLYGQ